MYKKVFKYNGHTFNITVKVNNSIKSGPMIGGNVTKEHYHLITITEYRGTFTRSSERTTGEIEYCINKFIKNAKSFVEELDNLEKTDVVLSDLGFKKC